MKLERSFVKENGKDSAGSFYHPFGAKYFFGKSEKHNYIMKFRCQNCEKDYNLNEL